MGDNIVFGTKLLPVVKSSKREQLTYRVTATADTRHHHVRELSGALEHLRARLAADNRLEVADHLHQRTQRDKHTWTLIFSNHISWTCSGQCHDALLE